MLTNYMYTQEAKVDNYNVALERAHTVGSSETDKGYILRCWCKFNAVAPPFYRKGRDKEYLRLNLIYFGY